MSERAIASRPSPFLDRWHKPVFILSLLSWAASLIFDSLRMESSPAARWSNAFLLCFATLSTLLALGRRLPLQNVVATAGVIAVIGGAISILNSAASVPFGPVRYTSSIGGKLFDVLPWPVPLGWIFVIVNGRGVARLIMRPWRQTNYYGFWVMGLTCFLAVIFDLGFEPFAGSVKSYWIWQTQEAILSWYHAPWMNFLGWFVASLAILVAAMPWLINKRPISQPVDYDPLILWLMLNIWVGLGNAVHHFWPAVIVSLIGNSMATVFAIRGAPSGRSV